MRVLIIIVLGFITQLATAQDEYANPVDGRTYVADWKTYQPDGGVKEQESRVVNSGVRLLSTQEDFSKNVAVHELAKLIGFIQETLTRESLSHKEGGEILLQIELLKDSNPDFQISYQGELSEEYLQKLNDALSTIIFKTKESTITFQIHFIVKNA